MAVGQDAPATVERGGLWGIPQARDCHGWTCALMPPSAQCLLIPYHGNVTLDVV